MDLSIIIVNWNSKNYLRQCIASILSKTHGIEFEIIVVDNGSFDGCNEMLSQYHPSVRFIQSDKNLGFGKANNLAFQESYGASILLLNPDTELADSAINVLYEHLHSLPNAGIVGCKILNADGSVQTTSVASFPTIPSQILDSEYMRTRWPRSRLWGTRVLCDCESHAEEVDAISGACIMLKRNVFEQVGLFSEEYFMYTEDIDLCYAVKHSGYRNYYVPGASIIHFGGGSSQSIGNNLPDAIRKESTWRFLVKTRGSYYASCFRIAILLSALLRMLVLIGTLSIKRPFRRSNLEVTSLKKWYAIFRWSLGRKPPIQASG